MQRARLFRIRKKRGLVAAFARLSRNVRIPFLAQAPLVVVFVGLGVAAAITWFGVTQLREDSDRASSLRATVLAEALSERLRTAPVEDRGGLIERAARRSGAEILLVEHDGTVIVDGSLAAPSKVGVEQLLVVGEGETTTSNGRSRFAAVGLGSPLEHLSLVVLMSAPTHPFGESSLVRLTVAFAAILILLGAFVAYALARSVQTDVEYVKNRIVEMAGPSANPAGQYIPVRTADAVGFMTQAFNNMVERFTAAEHAYLQDLDGTLSAERERTEFLAALSHELRTPLNVILGFTDVLLSEIDGPLSEDARENLTVVRRSGAHLQRLITDVLDLSALDSGQLRLNRESTDVYEIAQTVVREARVTAQRKGLALELRGGPAVAFADPVRVRQMIDNLVGNAIKFTSQGRVEVEVAEQEEDTRITVRDTGPGIAPKEQARIFEEYQQVGDVRLQRAGSGLGLAITRRLVKMHGATITLESRIGEGSAFTLSLPVRAPASPSEGTEDSAVPESSKSRAAASRSEAQKTEVPP